MEVDWTDVQFPSPTGSTALQVTPTRPPALPLCVLPRYPRLGLARATPATYCWPMCSRAICVCAPRGQRAARWTGEVCSDGEGLPGCDGYIFLQLQSVCSRCPRAAGTPFSPAASGRVSFAWIVWICLDGLGGYWPQERVAAAFQVVALPLHSRAPSLAGVGSPRTRARSPRRPRKGQDHPREGGWAAPWPPGESLSPHR